MSESTEHPRTGAAIRSPLIVAKRRNVRDRILDTGGRLFAARGLAQVSVEDILAEAKVSRRTFYGYFANKYELVASIINPALAEGTTILTEAERQSPECLLPGIVDCYLRLWASHRDALSAIASLEPGVMPYVESDHRKFGAMMKQLLALAEKAGALRNNDAAYTFKIITRTAVPLLKIYADHPEGQSLYREAMLVLLGKGD